MPIWLDVVFRAILFMIILFFITKFLGKKQLSQLSFFEYVTGITIGGIATVVILEVTVDLFDDKMQVASTHVSDNIKDEEKYPQ